MAQINMSDMLKAGLHFGHQTRRWNPKMKQFILTQRNGIHIINLFKSLDMIDKAYDFIKATVAHNGTVLFVGTKKQAQEAVSNQAVRVNMPYVSERWLGGMLTNFQTVSKRVSRLKELEEMDFTDVRGSGLTKKELLLLEREKDKLAKQLGGIRNMNRTPSAMFVVDVNKEALAVEEAHKLGIPVVAIVDTNADPESVEYPIAANDDAIRGIELLTSLMADAVAEGLLERSGKLDKLEEVRRVAEMVNILSVRQKRQLGLGHAVLCARELVGDEPFAVMVGDDLMFSGVPGIGQLIEVAMAEKMPVIGVMEVPWEKVSRYGIIDGEEVAPGVYRVRDMVEKPKREDAPSRMAIVGRYVLTPDIFDYLEKVKPGHGGEIQLTDALQAMAKDRGMMAVRMAGMRFDAGDWAEFLSANIYFALQDESLRYELLGLLKNFVQFK